jgi:hypothetical protein
LQDSPPGTEPATAPEPDKVTTALAEVTKTNATITDHLQKARDIAARHKDVVADVTTTKGYEEIAKIRTAIREDGRFPIQRLKDEGSKLLGTMQRQFNQRAEAIISEIKELEKPFQDQIDAEDERREAERQRRANEEQARKDGHAAAILAIQRMALDAVGLDSAGLRERIEAAQQIIVDDSYEEFQGQARQALDEAVRNLNGMLISALADEEDRRDAEEARRKQAAAAEAERAAREAAEQQAAQERQRAAAAEAESAALRDQLAAMQRAEAERQQREEAERQERERAAAERAAAIGQRIDAMNRMGAAYSHMAPSASIREALDIARATPVTADLFGDRLDEAQKAKDVAIGNLREVLSGAEAREAEEAAAALRARRDELLASIIGMGDNALLAVQDGSADVEQLQANLRVLEELDLSELGDPDRSAEFGIARDEAIAKAKQAIAATEERDRLAAEEAERQRAAEAERAWWRALCDAKRAHGEELYELARRIAMANGDDWITVADDARALLLKINPEEDFDA